MKEASYGCAVSPLTSPLGTIMRCARTSCRLDNDHRPSLAPRSMSCCFLCRQLRMPDFSSLKIEALSEHSLDVPRVSERYATFNYMDVVRRV